MPAAYAANNVPFAQLSGVDLRIYARHRPAGTICRVGCAGWKLLGVELLEPRFQIVHHSDMPESPRRVDSPPIRRARLVGAPERVQHLGELAVRVALIVGRGEVRLV